MSDKLYSQIEKLLAHLLEPSPQILLSDLIQEWQQCPLTKDARSDVTHLFYTSNSLHEMKQAALSQPPLLLDAHGVLMFLSSVCPNIPNLSEKTYEIRLLQTALRNSKKVQSKHLRVIEDLQYQIEALANEKMQSQQVIASLTAKIAETRTILVNQDMDSKQNIKKLEKLTKASRQKILDLESKLLDKTTALESLCQTHKTTHDALEELKNIIEERQDTENEHICLYDEIGVLTSEEGVQTTQQTSFLPYLLLVLLIVLFFITKEEEEEVDYFPRYRVMFLGPLNMLNYFVHYFEDSAPIFIG